MTELNYLVLLDTDRIKEYLFATNKLKEIRGASAILDKLNQQETSKILLNSGYGQGNILSHTEGYTVTWSSAHLLDWQMVYFGGGAVQILFKEKEEADRFCLSIEKRYHDQTDGVASITGVVVERKPYEEFKEWVKRGHKALRKRKDEKYLRLQPLSAPHFKSCESSGIYVAETYDYSATPHFIHRSVSAKRQEESGGFLRKFKTRAKKNKSQSPKWQNIENAVPPEDLNEIGNLFRGYVGFIYADGNRMGTRFQSREDAKAYSDLSTLIQTGTENAIFDAMLTHLRLIPFEKKGERKWRLPFQLLILGGDDLMVVVPANKAIEIAKDFCDQFKGYTGISISAGVLITHANYPIHLMMEHAGELLKSAKRLSNNLFKEDNSQNEVCTIDYMVLKGALFKDLKTMRQEELTVQASGREPVLRLYQRPYTTSDLENLINSIREFKKSGFPHSRLKSIYRSLYRGRAQATLDLCLMMSRLEKKPCETMKHFCQKQGLPFFPWQKDEDKKEYMTPFIDLIELYDFIDYKKEDAS